MTKLPIAELAKTHGTPLFVINKSRLKHSVQRLKQTLPRVTPYYAIKANPHPEIISYFARDCQLGFDVASKGEMELALKNGADPKKMIFANTIKLPEAMQFAMSKGIDLMTFDDYPELEKIAHYAPGARVMARIKVPNVGSVVELSIKFGADPSDALPLLIKARQLGLQPEGISFHVGSQCTHQENFLDAFELASIIVRDALLKQIPLKMVDIGGGFPITHFDGEEDHFSKIGPFLRDELDRLLPSNIQLISEPGRFLAGPAGTLIMSVIGKSVREGKKWYYLNDGVYGDLSGQIFDHCKYQFHVLKKGPTEMVALAGPTCDSLDVISYSEHLPELEIGDLVYVENIGAYSYASATHFNFIDTAKAIVVE